jgi:fucose 4-O-acetylase-like acetyltransferase
VRFCWSRSCVDGKHILRQRGRSDLLDRAKGALILLVVIGHAIEVVGAPGPTLALYGAIYLFHMPAFLLVAGALVRPRPLADELRLVTIRLGLPYLTGAIGAALVALALTGAFAFRLLPPPWTLWFLVTLATLRLAASLLRPRALLVVALVAMLAGALVALPGELSLARSASLAPFFALGLVLGTGRLERLVRRIGATGALLLFCGGLALAAGTIELTSLPRSVLFWRDPLTETLTPVAALGASGALHLGALAATLAALALVACLRLPAFVALAGRESLSIYLGHALLLALLRPSLRDASLEGVAGLVAIVMLAIVATLVPLLLLSLVRALRSPAAIAARPPAAR